MPRSAPALLAAAVLAAAAPASAQNSPVVQWEQTIARNNAIEAEVGKIEQEFETADAARKVELRSKYQELVNEYRTKVFPAMERLAEPVFKADPSKTAAGEIAATSAWAENRYADAKKYARALVEADPENTAGLSILPASEFALHEFEASKRDYARAERAGKLDPEFGRWKNDADQYVAFWKEEQELREKQKDADLPRVLFKTDEGDIELELFEEEAPDTVANMVSLIEKGFYDGIKFHRVLPNFVIQGGDPNTKNDDPADDGQGGPGYAIRCECYSGSFRRHFRGSLSMAHAGKDTGGSQFFITHLPTPHLNYAPGKTQSNHTVFGRVVKGMDVVDKVEPGTLIESATVLSKRDHEYKPETIPE